MNREKSEAKFICIRDSHAFKMDLWCAGHDFFKPRVNQAYQVNQQSLKK
jgi:hypothetical protein